MSAAAILTTGHTFRAEAIADVGGTAGQVDSGDHKWQGPAVGPIGADAVLDVPHGTTASTWPNGAPCP